MYHELLQGWLSSLNVVECHSSTMRLEDDKNFILMVFTYGSNLSFRFVACNHAISHRLLSERIE